MANTFLSANLLATTTLEILRRELMLPRYVTRLGLADFRGKQNDTVNMRVPAILTARDYEWRTRNAPIVLDEITELSVPVELDKHIYSAVGLTDEELTLDIVNFTAQVLSPQAIATAERIEALIATAMTGATYAHAPVVYAEDADSAGTPFYRALVEARKVLNAANVPQSDRVVIIGSDVEAAALKEEDLRRVNTSGGTQTLRRGELGQLAGFTVVQSNSVPGDFGVAFHRSAFVFANVAPVVPEGVVSGRSIAEGGIAMRYIRDYDPNFLRDRSVVSSFAGTASVEDARDDHGDLVTPGENQRAVLIDFTAAGS
jgi:hypothetical protein